MNISRQAFLKMLQLVITFLEKYFDILKDLPKFQELLSEAKSLQAEIFQRGESNTLKTTGAGSIKTKIRDELEMMVLDITSKLKAYAKFNDESILPEVSITHTEFLRFPEIEFVQKTKAIAELARNLGNLSEYRVDEDLLHKFDLKINEYTQMAHVPRESMLEKKGMNRTMNELFASVKDVVKRIDIMMGIIRTSNPNVYSMYKDSRKIMEFPGQGIALRIKILDSQTNEPLRRAHVSFLPEDSTEKIFTRRSAQKGGIYLKNLQPGKYKLTATYPGYEEKQISVSVSGEEMVKVVIPVEREK